MSHSAMLLMDTAKDTQSSLTDCKGSINDSMFTLISTNLSTSSTTVVHLHFFRIKDGQIKTTKKKNHKIMFVKHESFRGHLEAIN